MEQYFQKERSVQFPSYFVKNKNKAEVLNFENVGLLFIKDSKSSIVSFPLKEEKSWFHIKKFKE